MIRINDRFFLRHLWVPALDALAVGISYYLAFLVRFDFAVAPIHVDVFLSTLGFAYSAFFLAALTSGLYRRLHHISSLDEMGKMLQTTALTSAFQGAAVLVLAREDYPLSILLIHPFLLFFSMGAIRAAAFEGLAFYRRRLRWGAPTRKAVLIGAGELGEIVLGSLLRERSPSYEVVGVIDDDPRKRGMRLCGVRITGGREALGALLRKRTVDEVIIAIAASRASLVRDVVEAVQATPKPPEIKIAPSLFELLRSPGERVSLRKVRPADLLNREVVRLDAGRIAGTLRGKIVLVSGAGGTIGAELCRQVLKYEPDRLLLLENHATSLFYLHKELLEANAGARVVPVLGDVRDNGTLERIFKNHRPQVVLHAAAHKHVFQLESNILEAVSNNTLGTYALAKAADRFGAEVFLLVSTDKAVRPSSVMGASKRAAEIVVRNMTKASRTRFAAVRFGNVLGSSGSVLKIFQEQLSKGEPISITDAEATRYFMTVEEAAGLILQASSMAAGGEIFVLKMGSPVRIMDMAKNLIALSGLQGGDVEIRVTGLRQGEKAHEELVEDSAGVDISEHPEIMRLRSENGELEQLTERMLELELSCRAADDQSVLRQLRTLVPTFQPAAEHSAGGRAAAPILPLTAS